MTSSMIVIILFTILSLSYAALPIKPKCILVFGGTGKTGSECVFQALNKGNRVIVLARDPSKLVIPEGSGGKLAGNKIESPNLVVIQGSVTNQNEIDRVFNENVINGVIVALGGRTKDVGPNMLTVGTTNIVNAMKRNGVKRIAVVTSLGTGDSKSYAPFKFKILMYTVMKKIFADKNSQENIFVNSDGAGHSLE